MRLAALALAAAAAAATFTTPAHAVPNCVQTPKGQEICLIPKECYYYPDTGQIRCYY